MGVTWEPFAKLSHKQVTPNEMNRLLGKLDEFEYKFIWTREPMKGERFEDKAFVQQTETMFRVAFKFGGKAMVAWCFLDEGRKDELFVQGKRAYAVMAKYYKAPKMPEKWCRREIDGKPNYDYLTSSAFLYTNPAYDGKATKAICYDMNGAYGWALEQPIPDTSHFETDRDLKEGEIGFLVNGEADTVGWGLRLVLVESGFANFCFKAMPSPYLRYVDRWFRVKKNSADPKEKALAKAVINESIGYLQLINPFIRATVVERCTKRIKSFMNEGTIYSNTDSICSERERGEFPLSDNLGDFKIEHKGIVSVKGFCYQWNKNIPIYRGVPKSSFRKFSKENGRPFDILSDEVPERGYGNVWDFDTMTRRLKRV